MDLNLAGKKAIVTGGSRGIGRAISLSLAHEGVSVALCARGANDVRSAVEDIERLGVRAFGQAVAVGDSDEFSDWVKTAVEQLEGVDIFVSNPSGGMAPGPGGWRTTFEVDLIGAMRGVDAAADRLPPGGSVVLVSSTAAVESVRMLGNLQAYGPIKAALLNYSNALAQRLGRNGVRVNSVSPGPTAFEDGVGGWWRQREARPTLFDAVLGEHPLGRLATDYDVAKAVTFLVSDAARSITGVNLVVDGGFTKRVAY